MIPNGSLKVKYMKVRILDNTIRFRVSMNEMEELAKKNSIESALHFPSNSLKVSIEPIDTSSNLDFVENKIKLGLNYDEVLSLHKNQKVGFSFVTNDNKVLFEKDFKCLTDRGEDETMLYKNPRSKH
jgi:hypothetical protein